MDNGSLFNEPYTASDLNIDFNDVIELITEYLSTVDSDANLSKSDIYNKASKKIEHTFYEPYNLCDLSNKAIEQKVNFEYDQIIQIQGLPYSILKESEKNILKHISDLKFKPSKPYIEEKMYEYPNISPFLTKISKTKVLSFNYTHTCEKHSDSIDGQDFYLQDKISHIHGKIKYGNEIVFGFGDEMDTRYIDLENHGDNEYLKNVKSVRYLQNDTYRQLLRSINEGNYQIYILGHSCGNSDRTLLNTLFEHENCCSIKVFYYQYKDDEGNIRDDFTEKSINITRCFKDKTKLREIVVNKEFCRPLVPVETDKPK